MSFEKCQYSLHAAKVMWRGGMGLLKQYAKVPVCVSE